MIRGAETGDAHLRFRLEIDEDGWPPVGVEGLPTIKRADGTFEICAAPFFLKGISVGDRILADLDVEGYVENWRHAARSSRSVIWLQKGRAGDIRDQAKTFEDLGCRVEMLEQFNLFAVDVPETVPTKEIDAAADSAKAAGAFVAFPSFRHENSAQLR